jgi:Ice-binding-like
MKSFMVLRTVRALARRAHIARVLVAIASVGLFAAACDVHGISTSGILNSGPLATIRVTPNPQTLSVNGTQQFTAVGTDADGKSVTFSPVWSIVAGGGTISSSGMFTAGAIAGTYTNTVMATSGGLSATATVTLTIGPIATIVVTPNPSALGVGATQQFVAVGKDANGNVVQFTPTWSVVASGGTIDAATGLFTAGAVLGTYANTVQASNSGVSGTATVVVTAGPVATITVTPNPATLDAGLTQQFTAVAKDASGNVVAITPSWSIVNAGGTIDTTTGLFTAGAATGTYTNTVKATSGAISGFATVVVNSPLAALATIVVTPNPATVNTNGTQQFTAVGRNGNGDIIAITPVWTVVNGGGTIDATSGLFTAGAVIGSYAGTVKATSGVISGAATVNVITPVPALASITVTPNPASVNTSALQTFTAVGRDASNNIVPIVPVWSIVNGGGTINAVNGTFTAGLVTGTFNNTVKATSGLISGTASVVVTSNVPAPIVSLGTAAPNGIMAGTAFTCVIGGVINANISISPGSTVTGFPPCVITGVQHLADAVALQAQIDLTAAYNVLAGLPCPPANAIVANLGGTTKSAGVYCTASGIGVTGFLTLDGGGDPNAVFVFQAGTSLTTAGSVVLINGASAKNVYWQVGSSATIGTASQWQGNILALTSITLVDNANLLGRALARNGAVSLGTNNIITLP